MRKIFIAAIVASGIIAVSTVVVSEYTKATPSELYEQTNELEINTGRQYAEQMQQLSMVQSHQNLFVSTRRLIAVYENLQQVHEDMAHAVYVNMAENDPLRFQIRRAECWVRNEDSTRCRAISKVARS